MKLNQKKMDHHWQKVLRDVVRVCQLVIIVI